MSTDRQRYREDLFNKGDIGGFCNVNYTLLRSHNKNMSPLQSWYAELQNFTALTEKEMDCDIVLDGPVIFMKLDFGGNMYHHFCDFFNLYASQHVYGSWFDKNVTIVMWDTMTSYYFDPFKLSWKVFTDHKVQTLMDFEKQKVCVRGDVMFPLLARMHSGLYYNTYVPPGCVGSNLFRAFSQHFLHRLNITNHYPLRPQTQHSSPAKERKIRVTLLQRGRPEMEGVYRQIDNQLDLVHVLHQFDDFDVQVVEYNAKYMDFEEQLNITHNSDIFIGMHGAGLTHFLFLPDWAVGVELFNCGDKNCYKDLARLRGIAYLTWESIAGSPEPLASRQGHHKRYGDNPKFWNWAFDVEHFKRLMKLARERVLSSMEQHVAANGKTAKDEL